MTKLQELIGLVEKANQSKNWAYYFEYGKNAYFKNEIIIDRCPIEWDTVQYDAWERVAYFCRNDISSVLIEACAKMRELIKEEQEATDEYNIVSEWKKEGLING